jgi:hypothetical protein
MSDIERAQVIEAALAKLEEAATLLNEFYDDPRIKLVLCELEGLDKGWFHWTPSDQDYLVDQLIDLLFEARGTPITDHWRGHPLTKREAAGLLSGEFS